MNAPLRWKLVAGFFLVFIAGLIAGAFLGAAHVRHIRADFEHHEALTERIRSRMKSRLDLTPEQMTKTAPIFDKTARQIEDIRKETNRRIHETFAAADDELAPALTPEQRAKLDALEAEKSQTPPPPEQASR